MKTTRTINHRHIGIGDVTFHDANGPIATEAKTEIDLRLAVAANAGVSIQQVAAIYCATTQDVVGVELVTNADYGRVQQECLEGHWIFESQMIERFDEEP